jgi:hypothetical protein
MKARERGVGRHLLESISDEGTRWLFVILSDEQWAITRNGVPVAIGTPDRPSLYAGVAKFTALTHPVAGESGCDPAVQQRLDRIERTAGQVADGKGIIETSARRRLIRVETDTTDARGHVRIQQEVSNGTAQAG